jgi:hypothetical protein
MKFEINVMTLETFQSLELQQKYQQDGNENL